MILRFGPCWLDPLSFGQEGTVQAKGISNDFSLFLLVVMPKSMSPIKTLNIYSDGNIIPLFF